MAEIKISALTSATALVGTEAVPVVQSGTTKRTTTLDIAALMSAAIATVSNAVSVERVARQADVNALSDVLSHVISAGGGGVSVTSNFVSQVSAQAASAIDVVSLAVDTVSDAISNEISNRLSAQNAPSAKDSVGASVRGAQAIANALSGRISAIVAGAVSVTSTEVSAVSATANTHINTVSAGVNTVSAALVVETNNRVSAVAAVAQTHSVLSVQVQAIVASAAATSVRVDAVSLAQNNLSAVVSGIIAAGGAGVSVISQEVSAVSAQAASAINVVSAGLASEISARTVALLAANGAIFAETANRQSADVVMSDRISAVSVAIGVETARALSVEKVISDLLSAAAVNTFSALSTLSAAAAATSVRVDTLSANYTSLVNRVSANSATGGGGGSVTSNKVSQAVSALNKASARSLPVATASVQGLQSALNALSYRISVLAAGGLAVSVTSTKLSIATAQATAAINVVSAAAAATSVIAAANTASLAGMDLRFSTLSVHVEAASAAATSADAHANQASAAATSVLNLHNTLSVAVANALSAGDVISAGIGHPQLRMVSGAINVISASGLTKISGLSVSVAAGGIYQVKAVMIHSHSAQATNGFGFGVSSPAATAAGGTWQGFVSVQNNGASIITGYFNQAGFGSITYSATPTASATMYRTELDLLLLSVAAGTVQLKARTSAATVGAIHIQVGSYIQAFKLN